MYQPELRDEVVRTLYRVARFKKEPMTRLLEGLVEQSLMEVDKDAVCRVCISEGNNQCEGCVLAQIGNGKELANGVHSKAES